MKPFPSLLLLTLLLALFGMTACAGTGEEPFPTGSQVTSSGTSSTSGTVVSPSGASVAATTSSGSNTSSPTSLGGCGGFGGTGSVAPASAPLLSGAQQFTVLSATLIYSGQEDGSEAATLVLNSAAVGCGSSAPTDGPYQQLTIEVDATAGQPLTNGIWPVGADSRGRASLAQVENGAQVGSTPVDSGTLTFVSMGDGTGTGVFDLYFPMSDGGASELSGNFSGSYCAP